MAKLRKHKLTWTHSDADQITGYRLYWSIDNRLNYDSNSIPIGKVSEITLPDAFKPDAFKEIAPLGESITIGIAALDKAGNESDITILSEAYRVAAPQAPGDFRLTPMDDFDVLEKGDDSSADSEISFDDDAQQDELDEIARIAEPLLRTAPVKERAKYYDDVGFRKSIIDG